MYNQLFDSVQADQPVRVGDIGTGLHATAIVTQTVSIERVEVLVVADTDLDAARRAFASAGTGPGDIVPCESHVKALRALQMGRRVILDDAMLLPELPVDVIVESTGVPEGGGGHTLEAINQGNHVVMVKKENDCVVGPILKHLADQAGVVYTAADGDQPSLLLGLVAWLRNWARTCRDLLEAGSLVVGSSSSGSEWSALGVSKR
jgi:predicted homoserine dehydrogenase-like protein